MWGFILWRKNINEAFDNGVLQLIQVFSEYFREATFLCHEDFY